MFTKLNEILAQEKPFIADPINLVGFTLSLAINLTVWLLIFFKIAPGGSNILLHYNVLTGPDWIGSGWFLYLIPAFGLLSFALNFWLAARFYKKEKIIASFFALATIAVQIIFLVASLVLITVINA